MVSFEDQYYDIHRKILTVLGLWPYQKWRFRIIQIIFCLSLLVSFLISELTTFITSEFNTNIALQVFSQVCPSLIHILKYNSFLMNSRRVKDCFERIRYEWKILKNPDEINIIRKYADLSRKFMIFQLALLGLFLIVFTFLQLLPNFLDVIAPLNESRKRNFPFTVECFVDQEQYFYPVLTHSLMATYTGSIGVFATGSMLMGYVLHICAMLKIASYRLERVNDKIPLISSPEKNYIICERIINAVHIHRRAIEFAEFILSSFMIFYFILIGIGVSSLTLNLFQLLQLTMSVKDTNNINGVITSSMMVIAHLVYLFAANLAGQIITDHNIGVFNTTYAVRWYTVSLQAQKLLLFMMQKNTKNYYFVIGGIFTASLECFATLTSMSVSYFTVIYSTQ